MSHRAVQEAEAMDLEGRTMEKVEGVCPYCGCEDIRHSGVTGGNFCTKCEARWR